jgi:hypothetical protein
VLACKHTTDHTHIAMLIASPLNHGRILAGKVLAHDLFAVGQGFQGRLVPGNVQVFVHVVEHEFKEFLSVLLRVYTPLRVEVAAYAL